MSTKIETDSPRIQVSRDLVTRLSEKLATTNPKTTQLTKTPLPSCRKMVEIVGQLQQVLFPGFCDSQDQSQGTIVEFLEDRLRRVAEQLGEQISIAIHLDQLLTHHDHDANEPAAPPPEILQRGQSLAMDFIDRLPTIREYLATDVQAAFDGDPACKNLCEVILCYPGLHAIMVHRIAHELYRAQIPFLPRMIAEWVHGQTGIDIHPGAKIGKHFFIDHGTGVVIGQTCQIGQHVKIYQGVTLGALSFPTDHTGKLVRDTKRHPTIQDNVVVYANATILGGRTIVGHDSVIGSNVWMTRSVDPFTTVMMEKPKLQLRDGRPNDFQAPLDYQI